jgi:arylsulfatase A-like enzyme
MNFVKIYRYFIITCIILFLYCVLLPFKNARGYSTNKDFNIVLITVDTLRADHLSCYGYERKTSPNIDKIAEQGIIFKNAIAPSSWTAPSMVSLFTSVYPGNHGVVHGIGYEKNKTLYIQEVFSDKLTTLPEILQELGYTTFAVANNYHLSEKFGFARGFDYFISPPCLPANAVNKIIYSWGEKIKNSNKYFLWIHYFDPHYPYHPRTPWVDRYTNKTLTKKLKLHKKKTWDSVLRLIPLFQKNPEILSNFVALYDSEINFVDSFIGELFKRLQCDKDTLIIITADHGEEFLEHGYVGHGENLYQETIHIPLILKLPYSDTKRMFERQVNLIDIMPTILQMLEINAPEYFLGNPLFERKGILSWLKESFLGEEVSSHYNFSELNAKLTLKTILTPQWKYIFNYGDNTEQLYNIESDHQELNNLIGQEIELENQLKEKLFQWTANTKEYPAKIHSFELSPQDKEKLKGLGYVK